MSESIKRQRLLTLQQASEVLGVHPNTMRNLDNKGELKAVRFGTRGDRRYLKSDIERYIKKIHYEYGNQRLRGDR